MTLHVPALPVGHERAVSVADAAADAQAARWRQRIEAALTLMATLVAVFVVSVANVALELVR